MADNTEVVNEAYGAFAKGDVPALLALMSNTVEWECPKPLPQAGSYHGPDGVGEFFAGIAASWPELNIGIDDMVASGDNVVAVGHGEGKLASGEAAAYGFAHVFTLADGKVVRFREYVDPVQGLL